MIRNSRFHCGRTAQRLMHSDEVVPAHIERDSMFQVLQFSAVGIGQASKTPELASQGQVAAFDMACRDVAQIRSAVFDAWDRSGNPACGTVPLRASNIVTRKQFDKHGVIGASGKVFLNRRNVPAQPVSRELETSINSFAQIAHEFIGAHSFTLPYMKPENHFRNAIQRNPHVLIAPLRRCVNRKLAYCGKPFSADIECPKCGAINVFVESQQPSKLRALLPSH
jgi:hypothetical protein